MYARRNCPAHRPRRRPTFLPRLPAHKVAGVSILGRAHSSHVTNRACVTASHRATERAHGVLPHLCVRLCHSSTRGYNRVPRTRSQAMDVDNSSALQRLHQRRVARAKADMDGVPTMTADIIQSTCPALRRASRLVPTHAPRASNDARAAATGLPLCTGVCVHERAATFCVWVLQLPAWRMMASKHPS